MDRFFDIVYKNIRVADVILEVLDARDPIGTRNKKIEKYIVENDKILLLIINKADLVPKSVILKWNSLFNKEFPTVYTSKKKKFGLSINILKKEIKKLYPKPNIKILIIGYPNVGKSTLINSLKGKQTVITSPEAGFTRGKQYIKLGKNMLLIDTPGVIPLDESSEADLVLKNAIRVEKIKDPYMVLNELFQKFDKKIFFDIYNFDFIDLDDFLEKFARSRGKLLPGNEPNIEEAAKMVIRDLQRGNIPYYFPPPQ